MSLTALQGAAGNEVRDMILFSQPWRRGWAAWLLGLTLLCTAAPAMAAGVKSNADPQLIRQGKEFYLAARYQEAQESFRQVLGQVGLTPASAPSP